MEVSIHIHINCIHKFATVYNNGFLLRCVASMRDGSILFVYHICARFTFKYLYAAYSKNARSRAALAHYIVYWFQL